MKKLICTASFLCIGFFVMAQEITKVAVVDLDQINSRFRTDSIASRDYEQKKAKYQDEIRNLQKELLDLKNKKLDAVKKNDSASTIRKYDALISSKTNFLNEYVSTKNEELKSMLHKLLTADAFYSKVYAAIKTVAEREGYTIVFNLQEKNSGIIWYSQTVNITDLVIKELE